MRVTTLKSAADGVGRLMGYYGGLAEPAPDRGTGRGPVDYYLDPDEPAGRWWGAGRPGLGVDGEVAPDELQAILEGRHPGTDVQLGRTFGDASARGFDATFSAPKSVSVLWALSPDPWVRAEVLAAHDRAVDAALDWFQTHGAVTRRGTDGVRQVDTLGVTAALFRQHTSRTVDPQLHTHALIAAKVQDRTGRWLSLDARFLMNQQRTIGWIYDAALRSELSERLGVVWREMDGGQADLAAVPETLRELFSKRSDQVSAKRDELIARWSNEHDGADPDARTIAQLERSAVLASRPSKAHGIAAGELHDTWAGQARAVGTDLEGLRGPAVTEPRFQVAELDLDQLSREAIRLVSEEASGWLAADVARHAATLVPPTAARSAGELVALVDQITERAVSRCVDLGPDRGSDRDWDRRRDLRPVLEHVTDRRLTTPDILRQEQALQDWAMSHAHPIGPGSGDLQADAADAIAGTGQIVLVVGPAGTGKTRTTATAVAQLQAAGRPVIGLAPSGKAADVLRTEAGCTTDTLAGFLTRHRDPRTPSPWRPGTTVIVDEAGMAATQDLAELVGLARRNFWRLVAVGDPAQLPSVGRGGVFAHWCDTVHHHTLDTPRRFIEPWEAEASLALRRGDPDIARTYANHDRLHTAHPALLAGKVAEQYREHAQAGRTVAITTSSRTTATTINQMIQDQTIHTSLQPRVELADGTHAYVGDLIATRRNDPLLRTDHGEQIRNRHTWTIDNIERDGQVTVSHPDRGTAVLPAGYISRHVELGWAVTGYGNQGDTVDIGIAVLEPGAGRNHAYVALTRGREANHAHIPDPTGTLDPADHLAGILTQSLNRESALASLERLHGVAGRTPPSIDQVLGIDRSMGREL